MSNNKPPGAGGGGDGIPRFYAEPHKPLPGKDATGNRGGIRAGNAAGPGGVVIHRRTPEGDGTAP